MTVRILQNPWRLLLAVNAVVIVGVFVHKIQLPPYVPYIHLLVDYHFGFIKRALIGAVVALFTAKVPVWLVFALGGATWLATSALYARLFQNTFGFTARTLPLFVFTAGSLLFVATAALFSIILVLIHHIHLLMYVPTIVTIVVIRHYLAHGCNRTNIAFGAIALVAVSALFLAAQFLGTMPIPEADFVGYLKTRMADPSRTDLLQFAYIWYQPLAKEISDTWGRLPHNILGVPVFALLIWLHTPLWRFFASLIGALASDLHKRLVIAALIGISLAYLVMFAMVFDYSRWISNWAVCMFLILHAVKMLPAARETELIPAEDRKTNISGLVITLIPRVGIVRPF
ncbi:hypothetical protein [Bradyrhizobium sp. CCBAU 53415]|uniref:hypothetical protein n=1 Tax=Bradyrhizobium sp. CCBAU 53415 TaxID=1325119 RepID=UPI0023058D03|nr:hypothetical protein [Bradyrhizobium sp. CCBAU 53415]MDA9465786.1 hypothetical protein [Bradyrhizobium sp. CCBAU 53415]